MHLMFFPSCRGMVPYTKFLKNPDYDQIVFTSDDVMLLVAYEDKKGLPSHTG